MSEQASKTESKAAQTPVVDETPLLIDGQPEGWSSLADVSITCHKGCETPILLPCISTTLARHSEVITSMLGSTDSAGWTAGLNALFADFSADTVKVFVAYSHACTRSGLRIRELRRRLGMAEEAPWPAVVDFIRLGHKLDSKAFSQMWAGYAYTKLKTCQRPIAALTASACLPSCDLAEEFRDACYRRVVERIYDDETDFKTLDEVQAEWGQVDKRMLIRLLGEIYNSKNAYARQSKTKIRPIWNEKNNGEQSGRGA